MLLRAIIGFVRERLEPNDGMPYLYGGRLNLIDGYTLRRRRSGSQSNDRVGLNETLSLRSTVSARLHAVPKGKLESYNDSTQEREAKDEYEFW